VVIGHCSIVTDDVSHGSIVLIVLEEGGCEGARQATRRVVWRFQQSKGLVPGIDRDVCNKFSKSDKKGGVQWDHLMESRL
jgi:hypothetical protein